MIKKTLLLIILIYINGFSNEFMTQVKPFERYEIKSQTSGLINLSKKELEASYIKDNVLLIKIDSKDEEIELQNAKKSLEIQKEIVKIKEENFNAKNRISQLTFYEKNNEKLLLLEAKKEFEEISKSMKKLKNEITKKSFFIKNLYVHKIFVNKNQYVDIGDKLFYAYDISKQKISIYLNKEQIDNLNTKKLYIQGKRSKFNVYKIHKIKDENKVSRYKVVFVRDNKNLENFYFDKIVKVHLK